MAGLSGFLLNEYPYENRTIYVSKTYVVLFMFILKDDLVHVPYIEIRIPTSFCSLVGF